MFANHLFKVLLNDRQKGVISVSIKPSFYTIFAIKIIFKFQWVTVMKCINRRVVPTKLLSVLC